MLLLVLVTRRRRSDTSVGARQVGEEEGGVVVHSHGEVLLDPSAVLDHLVRHANYP